MDNLCGDKCTIYLAEYYHDLNDPEAHIHMQTINQSTLINVKNKEGYNYNAANQQWIDCDKDESGTCIPNTDHLIFGQYLCFKNNPDENAITVVNQDMPCDSSS